MKRDIGKENLEGIQKIKQGKGTQYSIEIPRDISELRNRLQLTQTAFAALLGVNVRTLQDWEQGRRKPTGPALSLLRIAIEAPEVFLHQSR